MKSVMKQLVAVAILVAFAAPAMAAAPTKGTKSYQAAKPEAADQAQEAANEQQPADPSKIEPAAGDTAAPKADAGKSFKEEMRLPRKN